MSKYLELFKNAFDGSIDAKTKLENKPYIGYSLTEGIVYTVVPAKDPVIEGPTDNEIWYTTTDGNTVRWIDPYYVIDEDSGTLAPIQDSVTNKNVGDTIISTFYSNDNYPIYIGCMMMGEPVNSSDKERLVTLHIPSTFSIGSDAFGNCQNLKNVTLDGPCGIFINGHPGQSYFDNCVNLESFTIPLNSTAIPFACFSGCSSLTSITIPNSVTNIRSDAFAGCSGLNSITYEGTQEQWNAITKGSDWNYNVPTTYVQCSDGQVTL